MTSFTQDDCEKKYFLRWKIEFKRAFEFGSPLPFLSYFQISKFSCHPSPPGHLMVKQNNLAPMRRRIPELGAGPGGKPWIPVDAFAHHCRIFSTETSKKFPKNLRNYFLFLILENGKILNDEEILG